MSSDDFDERLRGLLITEVPAAVWHRALAVALSAEAVDPGEELVPELDADLLGEDRVDQEPDFENPVHEDRGYDVELGFTQQVGHVQADDDQLAADLPSTAGNPSDDSDLLP